MLFFKRVKIKSYELGLLFRDGEFQRLLVPGRYWFFDPSLRISVEVVSQKSPWLRHAELDSIAKSGALTDRAIVLDLADDQRGLVWIDDRFETILNPGLHALWTGFRKVKVEVVGVAEPRFQHNALNAMLGRSSEQFTAVTIDPGFVGLYFRDKQFVETLPSGRYAFWRAATDVIVRQVDMREQMLDISGQEMMTADKVTLRVNAVVSYRVADALRASTSVPDFYQALYREAQLALRAVLATRELESFLAEKDELARQLQQSLIGRAGDFGLSVTGLGIRDVILPGDMKELLNKVIESKKAAEANLVARKMEIAALRSQANSAKLLEENPVLMRMRELEILEKFANGGKLSVTLAEKGLAERLMQLI